MGSTGGCIALDASALIHLSDPEGDAEAHLNGMAYVGSCIDSGTQLVVPAPAAFELIRADVSSSTESREQRLAGLASVFRIVPFGQMEVLVASKLWQDRMSRVKEEYSASATARKLRADLMIVACAIGAGASALITYDLDMPKWAFGEGANRIEIGPFPTRPKVLFPI